MNNSNTSWSVDATRILTLDEIGRVLADLQRRGRRSVGSRANLVIFRLAACCGLRVSEICGLKLADVRVGSDRPHLNLPKAITKGHKARKVPLWWDAGTLADVSAWRDFRVAQGAGPSDPFVASHSKRSLGKPLHRTNARKRFKCACRVLGTERVADLTIHDGRHTAISHWLKAGRSLAEVREAAGHSSIATTSIYTHVVQDNGVVGSIFGPAAKTA